MTKKLIFLLFFFSLTPLMVFSLLMSFFDKDSLQVLGESVVITDNDNRIFSSSNEPGNNQTISSEIYFQDSIPILIENYLKRYNSPLSPYKDLIIEYSDRYSVDPFLIVAIAQQESNLGKKSPENCFNAWGWGIHKKGTKCYNNWPEAIESVIVGISRDYCSKNLCKDPCEMMKKYTPSSNGSWCFGVNQFISELKTGVF